MTERPILFSAPMVRALLAGTKTQTRRIVKFKGAEVVEELPVEALRLWPWSPQHDDWVPCPYGEIGDYLWVRETWAPCDAPARAGHFHYAADGAVGSQWQTNGGERGWTRSGHTMGMAGGDLEGVWVGQPSRWRPSIHMPRRVSRLMLKVTGVRVERLRDISGLDAMAEGLIQCGDKGWHAGDEPICWTDPRDAYRSLWESINGPSNWAANPWVWVVSFRVKS